MNLDSLRRLWVSPAREYSPVPFWFWNGDLTEAEIRRQMADFRAHGVWGVIPHARVPLPESIGFLTERWIQCIGVCLDEARQHGMTVWLYDEGMYPSGSAGGRVARANPEYRCQALVRLPRGAFELPSPWEGHPEGVVAEDQEFQYVRIYTNGQIRGMGYGPPPLASDLLNPEATACFLREGYDPYWERFREYFGSTVRGIFTDEPHFLGRGGRPGMVPWTGSFLRFFREFHGWDLLPRLPALWTEDPDGEGVRRAYRDARDALMDRAYYAPLSRWCEERGIALLGHPSGYGELAHLRFFQLPGQDVVWRQVTPEPWKGGGPDSVLGKISSSAAHTYGRARNCNELYGAYGWELTAAEMKWLADWLMVRGVDMLIPHAFYYTLEGEAKHERPPDVGPGNQWWPFYRLYADYVTRVCSLIGSGRHVSDIAVYDQGNETGPRLGYWLLQLQRDFDYVERGLLEADTCTAAGGELRLENTSYHVLVLDAVERLPLASMRKIHAFARAGGTVLALARRPSRAAEPGADEEVERLAAEVWPEGTDCVVPADREALGRALDQALAADVRCAPAAPALRVCHTWIEQGECYFLTNESVSEEVRCRLTLRGSGSPEAWDPETGGFMPLAQYSREGETVAVPLRLRPYESRVVVLAPARDEVRVFETDLEEVLRVEQVGRQRTRVVGWTERGGVLHAAATDGEVEFHGEAEFAPPPGAVAVGGPWRVAPGEDALAPAPEHPGLEPLRSWTDWADPDFSGLMEYSTTFPGPDGATAEDLDWTLNLGTVCEFAEVTLNGASVGVKLWPPFRWRVSLAAGENRLAVRVWNSLANRYEGQGRPSGLLGPVRLEARRRVVLDIGGV